MHFPKALPGMEWHGVGQGATSAMDQTVAYDGSARAS